MEILESIQLEPNFGEIRRRLHVKEKKEWQRVNDIVKDAWPLIHPRAVFKACSITSKQGDHVHIGRACLKSRILSRQLDGSEPVFTYVVTIGKNLEEKIRTTGDILEQFYLDTIGNVALYTLLQKLEDHLQAAHGFSCLSSMAPGSLEDWPLTEQGPLFSLLGDVETAIGVKLTEVFLMLPAKSESGIFFPTRERFISCQLCPREKCDLRKAKFDQQAVGEMSSLSIEKQ